MWVLLILFALFATCFLKYILNLQAFKAKLKDFKCPPQAFLLGHILQLSSDVLSATTNYIKEYGNLLHLNATFFAPVLLVSDREIIKDILSSSTTLNKGTLYKAFHRFIGYSLATVDGDKYRGVRKLLNPAFTVQTLERSINIFNSAASIFVEKLENKIKQEIHILPLIEMCTLDATFESLMGVKISSQINEDDTFAVCTNDMHDLLKYKVFSPWCLVNFIYFFTPTYWKETELLNKFSKVSKDIIEKRRLKLYKGDPGEDVPFLDALLMGNIDGKNLSDQQIIYEINTFLLASRDTVVSTLICLFHALSHNRKIQSRVVDDIKTTFNDDMSRSVTSEDIRNMKYMDAVIKETMRRYPAVPFIARKFKEDHTFNGVLIPADINVILCIHALHMNEEYFPNPHVFDPERFYGDNAESIKPFSYIPFSAGIRSCIGQKHGLNEVKVILTHLLRRYELLPVGDEELHLDLKLTLTTKYPVKIRIQPRVC